MFLFKFYQGSEVPWNQSEMQIADPPTQRDTDSKGLGLGSRICTHNKRSEDADAASLGITPEELLPPAAAAAALSRFSRVDSVRPP